MKLSALGLGLIVLAGTAGSGAEGLAATPTDIFIQRFLAKWSGGGSVLLSLTGSPWSVNCQLDSTPGDNAVTLSGRCGLKYLFFISRSIEARLRYVSGSDSYSGTYSVDGGPPAILSGRRTGNNLNVNVRWPQPVNGHRQAVIAIGNDGHVLTLKTIDPLGVNGTPITTADLAFVAQ